MKFGKKVSNIIKKEFDSKSVCNEKYMKTKTKSYNEKINTNFQNNKISKEGSQCICLSLVLIDSVYRKDKNYYPQVFLEEFKYVVKEEKMSKFITDNMKKSVMKKIKYRFFFFLIKYKKVSGFASSLLKYQYLKFFQLEAQKLVPPLKI